MDIVAIYRPAERVPAEPRAMPHTLGGARAQGARSDPHLNDALASVLGAARLTWHRYALSAAVRLHHGDTAGAAHALGVLARMACEDRETAAERRVALEAAEEALAPLVGRPDADADGLADAL